METRSRKRAEAAAQGPTTRGKPSRVPPQKTPNLVPSKRAKVSSASQRPSRLSKRNPTGPQHKDPAALSSFPAKTSPNMEDKEEEAPKAELDLSAVQENDKGKGKGNSKEREREKEREQTKLRDRVAAAAAAAGMSEALDDDQDMEGALHQHGLASASHALNGLLRKLGAGLDDLLPPGASSSFQNSRLKGILSGLRAEGQEGRQLEALSQLCEILSIGTEDSLSNFSVDSFVPVLVGLLNSEYNPDIMLLAARALTHLCDVLPSSCAAVVHYGAVPCFCARLLTIEYIDLAEQSLQALEKISHEHPGPCLRAGGLMAVLSYLDFFSTGVQRVALSTAANICRQLSPDSTDMVMEAVPNLTNLLQYQDTKVVEHACICLTRIADSMAGATEKLDRLCAHGLLAHAVRLISVSAGSAPQVPLSSSTYTGLVRLLATCAAGSGAAVEKLLLLGISATLKDVLLGSTSASTISRPPDQLYEIVSLAHDLLPALPDTGGASASQPPPTSASAPAATPSTSRRRVPAGRPPAAASSAAAEEDRSADKGREKLLQEQPALLEQFASNLLPVLIQVYGSSINPMVRRKCLGAITKVLFLAGALASSDTAVLNLAIVSAEMLMQKLPDQFRKSFVKEGVVHAIGGLIAREKPHAAPTAAAPKDSAAEAASKSMAATEAAKPCRGGSSRRGRLEGQAAADRREKDAAPPRATEKAPEDGPRAALVARLQRFKDLYFPAGDANSPEEGLSDSLKKLKELCGRLTAPPSAADAKGKGKAAVGVSAALTEKNDEDDVAVLRELLAVLSDGEGVSTFEFIGSGAVEALLAFFSCGLGGRDAADDNEGEHEQLRLRVSKRLKHFVEVALPPAQAAAVEEAESPMLMLVRKLQAALASLERFPVMLSHATRAPGAGGSSVAAGLSALTQPFKLRLSRASSDKLLRDYSSNIVLIEPLATLAAVEDFLWPRVNRHDASAAPEAGSTPAPAPAAAPPPGPSSVPRSSAGVSRRTSSRAAAAADGEEVGEGATKRAAAAGGSTLPGVDRAAGPMTRRRAAAAQTSPGVKEPYEEEEDEEEEEEENLVEPMDMDEEVPSEDEDDEDNAEDEEEEEEEDGEDKAEDDEEEEDEEEVVGDDVAAPCGGDRVHDVRLGGDRGENAAGPSSSSVPAAAAAAATATPASVAATTAPSSGGGPSAALEAALRAATASRQTFAEALASASAQLESNGLGSRRERRSMATAAAASLPPKLAFSLGGRELDRSMTIFQAIQLQAVADEEEEEGARSGLGAHGLAAGTSMGRKIWEDVYTISYRRADALGPPGSVEKKDKAGPVSSSSPNPAAAGAAAASSAASAVHKETAAHHHRRKLRSKHGWQHASVVDTIMSRSLPCDLDKKNPTYSVLLLLRVLDGLNRLVPRLRAEGAGAGAAALPAAEFVSSKLTPKLSRQMQDAVALCSGGLPAWCRQLTSACPFLFPFETRRQYFNATALGLSRALQRLQQQQSAAGAHTHTDRESRELRVGRLQRQKVRVSRDRILESGVKVMELYAGHKAVLEVEYFGEVGTGLGPTLEFYTLLSHELQKTSLRMWRTSAPAPAPQEAAAAAGNKDGEDVLMQQQQQQQEEEKEGRRAAAGVEYVTAPLGLFPRPWRAEQEGHAKVVEHFRLLGRVMAKALQDGRLLDMAFAPAFYKLLLGQELDVYDMVGFEPQLARTLLELQALVARRQEGVPLLLHGCRVDDLCLSFTLPGHPEYLLKPHGDDIMVTEDSVEEYVALVVEATVFQLASLEVFNEEELEAILCGRKELWRPETLAEHLKFDHGYTASSPPIVNLLEIMGELTPEEQHAFLRFVTGAPRLPPGGLACLTPKLTIVRKHPTGVAPPGTAAAATSSSPGHVIGQGTTLADGDLPSVMTCANYLKLPPYSCKEVMKERIMYAIREGQGSFDLS
eukprot:jgi/Mesen1/8606/ME000050S08019